MTDTNTELIVYRLNELREQVGRVSAQVEALDLKLQNQGLVVEGLRIKSGVWGAMGGAIPAVGTALYFIFGR